MKVKDILGEELSPEVEERLARDLAILKAKVKSERDWGRSRRSSRLRGHGRGTGSFDRSMSQR